MLKLIPSFSYMRLPITNWQPARCCGQWRGFWAPTLQQTDGHAEVLEGDRRTKASCEIEHVAQLMMQRHPDAAETHSAGRRRELNALRSSLLPLPIRTRARWNVKVFAGCSTMPFMPDAATERAHRPGEPARVISTKTI
jgi:hypothetical protein